MGKAWQGRAFLKSSHTSHIFGLCLVNLFHRRKANHLSSGVNNHKMNAYQLCSGKCLITGSSTGLKSSYLYVPVVNSCNRNTPTTTKFQQKPEVSECSDGRRWALQAPPAGPSWLRQTAAGYRVSRAGWRLHTQSLLS